MSTVPAVSIWESTLRERCTPAARIRDPMRARAAAGLLQLATMDLTLRRHDTNGRRAAATRTVLRGSLRSAFNGSATLSSRDQASEFTAASVIANHWQPPGHDRATELPRRSGVVHAGSIPNREVVKPSIGTKPPGRAGTQHARMNLSVSILRPSSQVV